MIERRSDGWRPARIKEWTNNGIDRCRNGRNKGGRNRVMDGWRYMQSGKDSPSFIHHSHNGSGYMQGGKDSGIDGWGKR